MLGKYQGIVLNNFNNNKIVRKRCAMIYLKACYQYVRRLATFTDTVCSFLLLLLLLKSFVSLYWNSHNLKMGHVILFDLCRCVPIYILKTQYSI